MNWQFHGSNRSDVVQPEGMSDEEGRKWRYQRYIKDYLACVKLRIIDTQKLDHIYDSCRFVHFFG